MAGLIFMLRVCDMSLDTLRVLMVMRGRKLIAWVLGFFQAAIAVLAISVVLKDLHNILNVIGYAGGFATGNVVGLLIEERLAFGFIHFRIVSSRLGSAISDRLRDAGYAITEIAGRGKDGMVTVLYCSVKRKDVNRVHKLISEVDGESFVSVEDVRSVKRGFWRS